MSRKWSFRRGPEGGVFANFVSVFDDIDYVTIDFARLDPRDSSVGFVVAV